MSAIIRNIVIIDLKCDCCGFKQSFEFSDFPTGWHTEKEDHSDNYCPSCPYDARQTGKCLCGNLIIS